MRKSAPGKDTCFQHHHQRSILVDLPVDLVELLTTFLGTAGTVALNRTNRGMNKGTQLELDHKKSWRFMDLPFMSREELRHRVCRVHGVQGDFSLLLEVPLRYLIFDDTFNQPLVQGVFPVTLTHLTFGKNFNQPLVPGVFPETLTHLTFGENFAYVRTCSTNHWNQVCFRRT